MDLTEEDIDEIVEIISYNLSYNISVLRSIEALNITEPNLIRLILDIFKINYI